MFQFKHNIDYLNLCEKNPTFCISSSSGIADQKKKKRKFQILHQFQIPQRGSYADKFWMSIVSSSYFYTRVRSKHKTIIKGQMTQHRTFLKKMQLLNSFDHRLILSVLLRLDVHVQKTTMGSKLITRKATMKYPCCTSQS